MKKICFVVDYCVTSRNQIRSKPILDKDSKALRGSLGYQITKTLVLAFTNGKWLASNYHGSEILTVAGEDNTGRKRDIECSQTVRDCNCYIGGVDNVDQFRMTKKVDKNTKKCWH